MPILAGPPTDHSARARFRTLPGHDTHPAKLDLEPRLAPDHLARTLDHVVDRLDLSALRACYGATGSAAHPPERLRRVVLYERRRGHHSPAAWHRDACECEPVRWLLRGAEVSRSCWYTFRDRVGPLLLARNQHVLAQAVDAGVTTATRGAEDGTLVAANASRHKLVNQATLLKRAACLATVVAADQQPEVAAAGVDGARASLGAEAVGPGPARESVASVVRPAPVPASAATAGIGPAASAAAAAAAVPPARPQGMASSVAGRRQQQQRLEQAQQRREALQDRNQKKWASQRRAADAIVRSLGDPEAVVGRDKEKVYRPLYNVQVVDDLESPLILGYEVFAQPNDTGVLGTMLAQVRQQVGHDLEVLLAEAAEAGGADLAAAERAPVTVQAPVPGDGVEQPKQIPKREFTWQAAEQT
jgi:transposase